MSPAVRGPRKFVLQDRELAVRSNGFGAKGQLLALGSRELQQQQDSHCIYIRSSV